MLALYLPPRYTVKQEQLEDFYNIGSWWEETTLLRITGDPDSLYPQDANYSK
jgi:hypothetical protein